MALFADVLRSGRVLLMDGAMGTELRRAGLPEDACGEIWNITHPERVRAVHQAYADAGAEVLLTNTFQANRPALSRGGSEGRHSVIDTIRAAKEIIEPLIPDTRYALCSGGPIVEPPDNTEFPDLREFNDFVIGALSVKPLETPPSPISGVVLETCSTPRVRFAVGKLHCGGLPVLLSLTFRHDAKRRITTLSGHTPEWFARRAKEWGVVALGVNCGRDIDMSDIIEIIQRYRQETDLSLFARPNAGTPTKQDGRWVWPQSAESMAARLPELIEAGATMIGGCCGTTPEYISAFRRVIDDYNESVRA